MFSPSKGELEGDYGLLHQTGQAPPENTEFVTIYTAIINELQGNTTGRTIPTKTILEKMAATQRRSQPNVLAETALASYFGYDYTRSFETEKTETLPTNATAKSFSIIPNPTNNYFDVYLSNESIPNQQLSIYDINGRLLQTTAINGQHTLVNVAHLPSGMYYCKLSNDSSVQKLVIIK